MLFRKVTLRWLASLLAGVLVLAALAVPAQAKKDRGQLEEEEKAKQAEIQQFRDQADEIDKALVDAYIAIKETEAKLPKAQADVADATAEFTTAQTTYRAVTARLKRAEKNRDGVETEIRNAQVRVAAAKRALGDVAREVMLQDTLAQSDLMLLLGATTLEQLNGAYIASQTLSRSRAEALSVAQDDEALNKNREARLVAVTEEVAELKDQAKAALQASKQAKRAAETAKADLDSLLSDQTSQAAEFEKQKIEAERRAEQAEVDRQALKQQLLNWVEDDRQTAEATGQAPPAFSGHFSPPLSSLVVTSPFGYRVHPILGYSKLHTGTDFSASCGTYIYASADGVVRSSQMENAWGNRIVVTHGTIDGHSYASSYNHLSRMDVSPGQQVKQGDKIGEVGTTGWSTGCHLHFEIYVDGDVVNPMGYL